MRRRTELYRIGRGEAGPQPFRYPGHSTACPHAGEAPARYPPGWADDRSRYPGEIALRDLAAATPSEQTLVLARFATGRWLHRLLTGAPAWELEAERQAAYDYASATLPPDQDTASPASGTPGLRERAAATLRRLTEPSELQDTDTLLTGLRQAATDAAALHQPGGALAMGRFGYLAALSLGAWKQAEWFARALASYVAGHGAERLAGRWVRRARALTRRVRDSTIDAD